MNFFQILKNRRLHPDRFPLDSFGIGQFWDGAALGLVSFEMRQLWDRTILGQFWDGMGAV